MRPHMASTVTFHWLCVVLLIIVYRLFFFSETVTDLYRIVEKNDCQGRLSYLSVLGIKMPR